MFSIEARLSPTRPGNSAPRRTTLLSATRVCQSATSVPVGSKTPRSFPAPNADRVFGAPCFQQVAHSFPHTKDRNHRLFNAFGTLWHKSKMLSHFVSVISTLFVRSFAQERKSTPLFSIACALFGENLRGYPKFSESAAKLKADESGGPSTQ
jgi:hypothetical protein